MTRSESGKFVGKLPTNLTNPYRGKKVVSRVPWFQIQYELDPGPVNILTPPKAVVSWDPSHPVYYHHAKTIVNFKDHQFLWGVMVDASLHKKPTIRHRVKRRFKQALSDYIRELGWDLLGQPEKKSANETLHGALQLRVTSADPWAARELPWPEVQELAKWALDKFLEARKKNNTGPTNEKEAAALRRKHEAEQQRIHDRASSRPWDGSYKIQHPDMKPAVQTRMPYKFRNQSPPVRFPRDADGKEKSLPFQPAMIRRQVS
jgi:hypothetical protein